MSNLPHNTGAIALYAVRYAMGRQTSAPEDVIRWCMENWAAIDRPHQDLILRDVSRELERPERLGSKCDVIDWRRFAEWMKADPERSVMEVGR